MGLFGPTRILCKQGVWTNVVRNVGSGFPKTFRARLTPAQGVQVEGQYRERRAFWIVPMTPTIGRLAPLMRFQRDWINAYYSIAINPRHDLWIEID